MQKSTSKIRSETKVVVSRESETTFESTATSEIRNPNDEIAVTYVYQMLQRQYAINTYLAEVTPVILIPERVPERIDLPWLTRHAAILERNLRDDTYRDFLRVLRATAAPEQASPDAQTAEAYAKLRTAVEKATTALGQMHTAGGTYERIFDSAFAEYAKLSEAQGRAEESRSRFANMLVALVQHVTDNLLHYLQAVWAAESPEMRSVRYAQRLVATNYRFVASGETTGLGLGVRFSSGEWVINEKDPGLRRLSDLIDPSGPISFYENYAVYTLRSSGEVRSLTELFAYYRLFYSTPPRFVHHRAGSNLQIGISTRTPHSLKYGSYVLTFRTQGTIRMLKVERYLSAQVKELIADLPYEMGWWDPSPEGLVFLVTQVAPAEGEQYRFQIVPPVLEDPEVREVKLEQPLPPAGDPGEANVFTTELLEDMLLVLPGLGAYIEQTGHGPVDTLQGWQNGVPATAKDAFRRYYYEYVVRKRHLRFVVVDTNNVVLNLFTSDDSALEPFKRAHRYLDVLKAEQDVERRRRLLAAGDLADPDIETVVRVGSDGA
jgi:hypothetical protein